MVVIISARYMMIREIRRDRGHLRGAVVVCVAHSRTFDGRACILTARRVLRACGSRFFVRNFDKYGICGTELYMNVTKEFIGYVLGASYAGAGISF